MSKSDNKEKETPNKSSKKTRENGGALQKILKINIGRPLSRKADGSLIDNTGSTLPFSLRPFGMTSGAVSNFQTFITEDVYENSPTRAREVIVTDFLMYRNAMASRRVLIDGSDWQEPIAREIVEQDALESVIAVLQNRKLWEGIVEYLIPDGVPSKRRADADDDKTYVRGAIKSTSKMKMLEFVGKLINRTNGVSSLPRLHKPIITRLITELAAQVVSGVVRIDDKVPTVAHAFHEDITPTSVSDVEKSFTTRKVEEVLFGIKVPNSLSNLEGSNTTLRRFVVDIGWTVMVKLIDELDDINQEVSMIEKGAAMLFWYVNRAVLHTFPSKTLVTDEHRQIMEGLMSNISVLKMVSDIPLSALDNLTGEYGEYIKTFNSAVRDSSEFTAVPLSSLIDASYLMHIQPEANMRMAAIVSLNIPGSSPMRGGTKGMSGFDKYYSFRERERSVARFVNVLDKAASAPLNDLYGAADGALTTSVVKQFNDMLVEGKVDAQGNPVYVLNSNHNMVSLLAAAITKSVYPVLDEDGNRRLLYNVPITSVLQHAKSVTMARHAFTDNPYAVLLNADPLEGRGQLDLRYDGAGDFSFKGYVMDGNEDVTLPNFNKRGLSYIVDTTEGKFQFEGADSLFEAINLDIETPPNSDKIVLFEPTRSVNLARSAFACAKQAYTKDSSSVDDNAHNESVATAIGDYLMSCVNNDIAERVLVMHRSRAVPLDKDGSVDIRRRTMVIDQLSWTTSYVQAALHLAIGIVYELGIIAEEDIKWIWTVLEKHNAVTRLAQGSTNIINTRGALMEPDDTDATAHV